MLEWAIYILLFWGVVIAVLISFINEKVREEMRIEEKYWRHFNERCRYWDAMFSKEAGFEEF